MYWGHILRSQNSRLICNLCYIPDLGVLTDCGFARRVMYAWQEMSTHLNRSFEVHVIPLVFVC